MKRIVLVFGLISGLISSVLMFLTVPLHVNGIVNFENGLWIGYTAIVCSFLLVFFGIRAYRDQHGGTITFGRGFTIGILITLISCVFYVVSWEIIYYKVMPDFAEKYTKASIAEARKKGASDAQIAETAKQMADMKKILDNPLTNAAYTFIEPFPVGLLITLISAAVLRRRASGASSQTATTAIA